MNKRHQPTITFLVSALLTVATAWPAYASDLETIVGRVAGNAGANVMLVIDTSGSMESEVLINAESYDATANYPGPFDRFAPGSGNERIFYTQIVGNDVTYPTEDDVDSFNYVLPQYYLCAAGIAGLANSGFYSDRHAQFGDGGTAGEWTFLIAAGNDVDGPIGEVRRTECRADEGVHGNADGDGGYPINIDPLPDDPTLVYPWSPDPDHPDRINWNGTSGRYIFFNNNFLNWIHERANDPNQEPVLQTRLEIVQTVASDLTNELKDLYAAKAGTLNLGIMRFNDTGSGGTVLNPAADITYNDGTIDIQQNLENTIQALSAFGNTPLAETMFEAKRYFAGESAFFGFTDAPPPDLYQADGQTYVSPITASCQKNYVVLLTDGQPVGDFQANAEIEALTGPCAGSCLNELTSYMNTADLGLGPDLDGVQSVETFVIGFFTDSTLLQDSATGQVLYGEDNQLLDPPIPGYFLADDPEQLADAFRSIFNQVNSDVSSFTAPAVSVNSLNRLTNRDTLYFTMFQPSDRGQAHWDGNLKAYKIGRAGGVGDITILDSIGNRAVDEDGTFRKSAQSVWSAVPDGGVVTDGGMADRLSANRKIYSNLTGDSNVTLSGPINNNPNAIATNNRDEIGTIVNLQDEAEIDSLIAFAQGINGDGSAAGVIGDPLHSEPLIINYGGGDDDLMLIFGTNDGYLHAVNIEPDTPQEDLERFAFIPKELLSNLPRLQANEPSEFAELNKAYGMDGPITAWLDETDGDFIVESGESLTVYAAMRRGGSSYYALDLSNRDTPKLKFIIDPSRSGFEDLGQTWSPATYGQINLNGSIKDVLFFGGGYDTNQDNGNTTDSVGNAVYIVDANNGSLIWSAGDTDGGAALKLDDMEYSIPSEVRIIDVDQDGYIDRMYVGDMGAQVWRFDIDSTKATAASAITGGLLAQLGDTGAENDRRFYSPPSVSRFVEEGRTFLTVSLGSGYRASPLNVTIDDRFYVLRDDNVFRPALVSGVPTYGDSDDRFLTAEEDLLPLNISADVGGTVDNPGYGIPAGSFGRGWMLDLNAEPGEKNLSPAITADGRVFFSTYAPGSPDESCDTSASVGTGRLYGIDILTGLPNLFGDADDSSAVLFTTLGPTGIPPTPKLVFTTPDCTDCPDDGQNVFSEVTLLSGTQTLDVDLSTNPVRTYWFQTDITDGE